MLLEKKKEILIAIKEGKIAEFVNTYQNCKKPNKRKGKKSEKLISYLEEEVDLGNKRSDQPVPPKKRKLTSSTEPAIIDTTTPGPTRIKEIKPAERSKEAQKLQAIKYFKMKSGIQVPSMSSTSIGEKEENPPAENIHQFTNQQETSSSLTCSSLGNPIEVNPLVKECLPTADEQTPQLSPRGPSPPPNIDDNQHTPSTAANPVYSAVGEGFRTLLFSNEETQASPCNQCYILQAELENKNMEVHQLQSEIESLRGVPNSNEGQGILLDLKNLITRWERPQADINFNNPYNYYVGQAQESSAVSRIENWEESVLTPPKPCKFTSTSGRKSPFSSTVPGPDLLSSVTDSKNFFEPGENKVKIVESHNLYIDSTKLVAIRHKGRKNPSKVVRDLLMYFFQPEYLAQHSATGLKSQKRGLPTEIIQPIREFLQKNFKIEDINGIINRKCLDIARSLSKHQI